MMRAPRIALVAAALSAGILVASGCGGPAIPSSYGSFNAKDGVVACKFPEGWTRNGGGAAKFHGCAFESGSARIRLMADISGSAVGDIAKSAGAMAGLDNADIDPELAEELAPVAQVHEMSLVQAEEDLGELDVIATETIQTGFGDTRRSEFTVAGSLGGQTHGYLVTALGHDKRIRVVCTCPEKFWTQLKPVFDEVIGSLERGQVER
jgi:hypothetical protein